MVTDNSLDRLETEKFAAEMLHVTPGHLRRLRSMRSPRQPKYVRVGGAIRYRIRDLLAYIESNTITV